MTKENERLNARVRELERVVAPVEEEIDDEKALQTRAELISQIRQLKQDILDTLRYGFNIALAQLKIVNIRVELVTKWIGPFHQVVNEKIIPPAEDNPEEKSDGKKDGCE